MIICDSKEMARLPTGIKMELTVGVKEKERRKN